MQEAPSIRSLSRQRAPRRTSVDVFGLPEVRKEIGEFLAQRMLVPGATDDTFGSFVEAELDAMNGQDRVWIEIEMASAARIGHSFDFDSSPWRR